MLAGQPRTPRRSLPMANTVQTTDIHNTVTAGITLTGGTLSWMIAAGVIVASDQSSGVVSGLASSFLTNHGDIEGGNIGVAFTSGSQIVNVADGSITGGEAIRING